MSRKKGNLEPNKLLRGSHGTAWFNGKQLATLQKCELKMAGDFEDVNVCGDPATYSLYNGWSGDGTLEWLKVDSDVVRLVTEAYVSGIMPEISVITLLENPLTGKRERCKVSEVVVTEVLLASFEKKALVTESVPIKFADFEYLETIEY